MNLSELEHAVILQMRDAMRDEYLHLVDSVKRAEDVQQKLVNENRYLVEWNENLISALKEHRVDVPPAPEL
jgi:heme oxygenase